MTSPTSITKTSISGSTELRKRLQDECRHLRGFHKVSMWFWTMTVCDDCRKPLKAQ